MDSTILKKLIRKEQLTDDDIEGVLHDICEDVHSSCDSSCPIYKDVLIFKDWNCKYFKNGKAMLEALKMVYE